MRKKDSVLFVQRTNIFDKPKWASAQKGWTLLGYTKLQLTKSSV